MDKQKGAQSSPVEKTSFIQVDGKDYKVISIFEGSETASKLLCDMAVNRILYEGGQILKSFENA